MNDDEWQQKIKEQLSDVDDLIKRENGVYITQYFVVSTGMKFPCPSLSSALAIAKKCLIDGKPVHIASASQHSDIINGKN